LGYFDPMFMLGSHFLIYGITRFGLMSELSNPSFDDVANELVTLGSNVSPAELHGVVVGRVCGGKRYTPPAWLQSAFKFLELPLSESSTYPKIAELYSVGLEQLESNLFDLEILLPDDDVEMEQRVTAMSDWCQGFLLGFGTSGVTGDTNLSAETSEALRDFAEFVQIDPEQAEDESDLMELVEYIRVAALTIFAEIGAASEKVSDATNEQQLH